MELIKNEDNLINRLRRIEGQVKGIQKMIADRKYCGDILIQIAAARAALNKVGGIILENYMKECILNDNGENKEEDLERLIDIMLKYTK